MQREYGRMLRILQFSDVHLGAPLGGFGDEANRRRRDLRAALRRLPALAERRAADLVIVAGDLFDGPVPDQADVDVAREVLRGLAEGGRPVFAVPGNHDRCATSDSPWRQMPDGVHVFLEPRFGPPRTVRIRGMDLHVYGIAYDPAVEENPLAGFERTRAEGLHLVVLHAGLADNPDWKGGHGLRTTSKELAALGADYIALGDYHTFRPPEAFSPPRACYSGSFAAVRSGETGPRGAAVVDLRPDAPPSATLVASDLPLLVDLGAIDTSGFASDLETAEHLGGLLAEGTGYPVVRLTGEPLYPLDADRIEAAVRERFGFCVVKDETRFIESDRVETLAREPSIAGHVARLGRTRAAACTTDRERMVAERALRLALRALEEV